MFLVLTKVFIIFWAPAISRYNINIGSHHTDVGIPEVPWLFGSCWQLWWLNQWISIWQEPDAHIWLLSSKSLPTWGFTQTPHEAFWHPQQPHPSLPDCVSFPCFHKHQPPAVFCSSSNSSARGDCPGPQTQGIGNTCLSSWSSIWSPQLSVKVNPEYFYSQQAQHCHHNCWEICSAFWSMPPDRGGQKPVSLLNMVFGPGNMVLLIP